MIHTSASPVPDTGILKRKPFSDEGDKLHLRAERPSLRISNQLARGIGLSVFWKSALASPLDATSCAPVRLRISFARVVHSELSE